MKRRAPAKDDLEGIEVAIARIVNYGGSPHSPFNGIEVQLAAYDKNLGWFETELITGVEDAGHSHEAGGLIYCTLAELELLTPYTREYVAAWTEQDVTVYPDHVYDLRDELQAIKVPVTAEAVAAWTPVQRKMIQDYVVNVVKGVLPVKPEELP